MKKGEKIRLYLFALLAVLLILTAVFGERLAPFDPLESDFTASLLPPGGEHLCGTDKLGRDVFSRILAGAGRSFFLTFLMVAITFLIGTTVGLLSGYRGGASDHILTGLCDILLAFPDSVFAIAVAGILGAGIFHTVFALGLIWWTKYARLSRTLTLSVGNRDYIWQAKFAGARTGRILFKYILPEILPQLLTAAALDVGNMMLALAGLSFLGLASQPPAPEWGYMLYESRQYMQTAPWMMIFPGLALLLSVGVFNLLGDAVRDALSPGTRKIDT